MVQASRPRAIASPGGHRGAVAAGPAVRITFPQGTRHRGGRARRVGDGRNRSGVMRDRGDGGCSFLLNANGLVWARRIIHEPAGMVVKNIAFLVLVWVCGAIPGGRL